MRWSVIIKYNSFFEDKVRQVLLQIATGITKCDTYYKVRRLLQSAAEHGQLTHGPTPWSILERGIGRYVCEHSV